MGKNKKNLLFSIFISVLIFSSFISINPDFNTGLKLINPKPDTGHSTFFSENIKPKLEVPGNTFSLKKDSSLIAQAEAFDEGLEAKAYIAVDLDDGKILEEKNSSQKLPIASLTKIMTAVVALDLADKNELFTVSENAASQIPTKIGVVPSEKMSLEELLNALLLTSANDAASVIEDGVNAKYRSDIFVKAMNEKASFLGLSSTSFSNPQGFDSKNNYSSLYDMAVLTDYAISNYPLIAEVVKKDYEFLANNSNHKQFDLYNWNGLIGVYPQTVGVKIGSTGGAGKTTIVISQREGKRILAGVLGAPDLFGRDLTAAKLLDAGYKKTMGLKEINITEAQLQEKYNTWQYF